MLLLVDFKNFYKYPPLINDTIDMDGSRGSIEKLPRASNFSRGEFVLWSGGKSNGRGTSSNIPILIPRQRFLRAKVTGSQVNKINIEILYFRIYVMIPDVTFVCSRTSS